MSKPIHFRQGVYPIFKQNLIGETKGWVMEIFSTIAVPLTFYLAFGLGLRNHISEINGVSYVAFMTPGLIALTIQQEAFRTGGWGLWLATRHHKTIQEYRIKPISMTDILLGELFSGFVIALIKGTLTAAVLFIINPFTLPWENLFAFLMMMFPGAILFTAVGANIGTTFMRPDQIAQVQAIVIIPLLYLGGLFFPIEALPELVQKIVRWLPTTAVFDGGRQAFLHGTLTPQYIYPLWIIAIVVFIWTIYACEKRLSQ